MRPPRFTSDVRERFLALRTSFDECEHATDEYEARFQERFTPRRRKGERLSLPDAARLNMLSAHARARLLTWGIITAVNEDLAAILFLAARAHLEIAAMMAYLLWKCRGFRAGTIASAMLDETLQRLFLGRRVEMDDDPPGVGVPTNEQAIGVLTLIDSVDHLFEGEARREISGEFRKAYDWLSEFCHPNVQSRIADHVIDGGDVVFLRRPRLDESDIRMTLSHVRLSDFVVSMCFTDFAAL